MWLYILLWAGITLLTIRRLFVILENMKQIIQPRREGILGKLGMPSFNSRPLYQLAVWTAEILLLVFFYSAFGTSGLAHMVAAVCGIGVAIMLREKDEPILEGLQLVPIGAQRSLISVGRAASCCPA